MTNIPAHATALVGRETELVTAVDAVRARRLVTLTGPGGIGKSRLATEVARRLLPEFADDIWMIDLAMLESADAVAPVIAATLNLGLDKNPVSSGQIAARVGSRNLLLVLDNCEHCIRAVADVAGVLLCANPAAHVLATSREPLLVEDERVCRISPLAVPVPSATNRGETLRLGAVKLFFARMQALNPRLVPDTRMAAIGGAICRRLDGIPLAIELAASYAAAYGIANVATQLDDHFRRLLGSRRTPLPRHKTLRATLDWRYGMLSAAERAALLRIAIFAGPFGLNEARAVVSDAGPDIRDLLQALVASSFVVFDSDGAALRYRLLGPIRAYGREKLLGSGDHDDVVRLHADYLAGQVGLGARREMSPCAMA
jgi:non-specific serine/threonine protein kinase